MNLRDNLCAGMGLEVDAERAFSRVLNQHARGRSFSLSFSPSPFSLEDHIYSEVDKEARALMPSLVSDLVRGALGAGYKGPTRLSEQVADARDCIGDAARRGRRNYASQKLRPVLLTLAARMEDHRESLRDTASEEAALRAWRKLDEALFALRELPVSPLEHPGKPPAVSRGSVEKLLPRTARSIGEAAQTIRRLALGPPPTEAGEAEKLWEDLLEVVAPAVSLMRGLARAADRERS